MDNNTDNKTVPYLEFQFSDLSPKVSQLASNLQTFMKHYENIDMRDYEARTEALSRLKVSAYNAYRYIAQNSKDTSLPVLMHFLQLANVRISELEIRD